MVKILRNFFFFSFVKSWRIKNIPNAFWCLFPKFLPHSSFPGYFPFVKVKEVKELQGILLQLFDWLWTRGAAGKCWICWFLSALIWPPKNASILLNHKWNSSVTANNAGDAQKVWNPSQPETSPCSFGSFNGNITKIPRTGPSVVLSAAPFTPRHW